MNTTLSMRYIEAKYGKPSRVDLLTLQQDVAKEMQEIKAAKEKIYTDFPGVHGRFQASQLDVLDIREHKACAMFDNLTHMLFAHRNS